MMNLNSSLMGREDSVEAPDYGFSARNNARAKYNMKKWAIRILLGVLIFIPYVCIIVLFSKVGESETNVRFYFASCFDVSICLLLKSIFLFSL